MPLRDCNRRARTRRIRRVCHRCPMAKVASRSCKPSCAGSTISGVTIQTISARCFIRLAGTGSMGRDARRARSVPRITGATACLGHVRPSARRAGGAGSCVADDGHLPHALTPGLSNVKRPRCSAALRADQRAALLAVAARGHRMRRIDSRTASRQRGCSSAAIFSSMKVSRWIDSPMPCSWRCRTARLWAMASRRSTHTGRMPLSVS